MVNKEYPKEQSWRRPLPPEAEMERDDALDASVAVINTIEPEHPYHGDPYPISSDQVDYGVTRTSHASCGPRGVKGGSVVVAYSTRLTHIRTLSREQHLALLTHEATHVTVGAHSDEQHGGHPPRFWREMAFNALDVRDALTDGILIDVFDDVDISQFIQEVVGNPNPSTVDRRYWTVEECKEEVASLLEASRE